MTILNIVRKLLGPKSKYDKDLPYLYEARIPTIEDHYKSFVSDKVCQLIGYLKKHGIQPGDTSLFEVYQQNERPIDLAICVDKSGQWLSREQLCYTFSAVYPGHIAESTCSFVDREDAVLGP